MSGHWSDDDRRHLVGVLNEDAKLRASLGLDVLDDKLRKRAAALADERRLVQQEREERERAMSDECAQLRADHVQLISFINGEHEKIDAAFSRLWDRVSEQNEKIHALKNEVLGLRNRLAESQGAKLEGLIAALTEIVTRRVDTQTAEETARVELLALQGRADQLAAELADLKMRKSFEANDGDELPPFLPARGRVN